MKYFASLCALVLAGSIPGFAASAHPTSAHAREQNQFHFKPSKRRAAQMAAHNTTRHNQSAGGTHGLPSIPENQRTQSHHATAKNVRRHTSNPPTGKIGFLAATDIPAGGLLEYNATSGDFNGDGKADLVSEVYAWDTTSSSYIYQVSVVLSNGDGTFQQSVLTPITNNDECVGLVVADVNGDGKADVLVGHNPGSCGNSYSVPTLDVLISKGDGTFNVFAGAVTVSTTGLAGGTVYDVNMDGKADLVLVDDNSPANVFTLLGNGDGTFQTPTSVALSGEVGNDVVIADLSQHGNGLLDIADNDYNTRYLTFYQATSASTYASAVTFSTPDSVYDGCSLGIGDLNGDGYPDLVNANCEYSSNDITVYLNNGNGTFGGSTETGVYYDAAMSGGSSSEAADVYANAVTIADVNGDGMADIVATNILSGDVTILFGNGDGTVNVPTMGYTNGGYQWDNEYLMPAIVSDFNNDGFADIIVPDQEFSFAYMRGYGDGTFHAALNYYAPTPTQYAEPESLGIASGDFNKDGHPDFVISEYCNGCSTPMGATVFLSNPDGTLQPGVNLGGAFYYAEFVTVADFNQDGNLDIAITDYSTGSALIFTGDGTGNFTAGTPFSTDTSSADPYGLIAADFNNDGYPDLAVLNYIGEDVGVLLNDKTGNFPTATPITLNNYSWEGLAAADLRGVGKLDLVIPEYYGGAVAVLLGNGDGTFGSEQDIPLPASYAGAVTIADLHGQGKLDIAVTMDYGSGQDIAIAAGNGDGTFQAPTTLASSLQDYNLDSPYPQFIQAVDVDGDGKIDLVYANSEYGTIGVLFGEGGGTFFDPVEYPVGQYDWSLAVADVNGDGAPDVVTANDDSGTATVLLNNNGSATMGTYAIALTASSGTVAAGSSASYTFTITPTKHYNGTITFSCPTGLPALTSCVFSPSATMTLDGINPQTLTLTITTKAPSTSSLRTRASVEPQSNPRPRSSAMLLASLNGLGVFGMFLAGGLNKKRTRWSVLSVLALAMTFFLVGCGGSSNSTTTGGSKSNSTSTVTSSAATVLVGQQVTFTGTVSGSSGTPTGTVTFLDGTTSLGTGTLSSGKATFQTSSLAAGVHNITITYGGDSDFNASTSTAYSQTVDNPGTASGSYSVTVSGTGTAGTNGVSNATQQIKVTLTVQ